MLDNSHPRQESNLHDPLRLPELGTQSDTRALRRRHCRGCGQDITDSSPRRRSCDSCCLVTINGQPTHARTASMTLRELYDITALKGKHASWRAAYVRTLNRSWNRKLLGQPCQNCGYDKHVELCHVKAISQFPETTLLVEVNAASNNVVLCRNCHWEFDHGLIAVNGIRPKSPPSSARGRRPVCATPGCGRILCRRATHCRRCANRGARHPTKIEWPPVDDIAAAVASSSYRAVGRRLGVSDNAIRKHLRRHSKAPPAGLEPASPA